jgi:lipoprotein-anchoring transpeptidase ErfK/SrfK
MKVKFFMLTMTTLVALSGQAKAAKASMMVEELVPDASNIEQVLLENDLLNADSRVIVNDAKQSLVGDCFRDTCAVYIEVNRTTQRATLRVNGELVFDKTGNLKNGELRATTGSKGHATPSFDRHPEAPLRAYKKYSSSKYPGGNWVGPDKKSYGNMPFVVFVRGGYGVHGTTGTETTGNISKLGTVPLSHGCIRIHPINAIAFNEAVTTHGAAATWIYVHD